MTPSSVERGNDEDRDAEDPDDLWLGQAVEELRDVDERGGPQVLEPSQQWRLRVERS